jgi:hypothetical protein
MAGVNPVGLLLGLVLIVVAACTTTEPGPTPSPDASRAEDDSFTLPSSGRVSPTGGPNSVSGVLTFDDIEGGCSYLEAADGTRFEVLYPIGWQLDQGAAELRGPAGERIAAGETVTVSGSLARGRSSICQVGPIFQATSVEIGGG